MKKAIVLLMLACSACAKKTPFEECMESARELVKINKDLTVTLHELQKQVEDAHKTNQSLIDTNQRLLTDAHYDALIQLTPGVNGTVHCVDFHGNIEPCSIETAEPKYSHK